MKPGCGEAHALLQRETGSHLICCCPIAVREGRFSARGVNPSKRPYPQEAMMSKGQLGQSSCSHIWEILFSSCIQQCYCPLVPVEVREERNHVFRDLCFSGCVNAKR